MAVKIKDKRLYEKYLNINQDDSDEIDSAFDFLGYVDQKDPVYEVKLIVDAIFNDEDVKEKTQLYIRSRGMNNENN